MKRGSVTGAMFLVTGSCIGAGMLGIPLVTGLAGFVPSLLSFLMAWGFMTLTALLFLEASSWFKTKVNVISMAGKSLGKVGKGAAWALYLFLFYALLVAYFSGLRSLFQGYATLYFSIDLPSWIAPLCFALFFGMLVARGVFRVDLWNRLLVIGKIGAFGILVVLAGSAIDTEKLLYANPKAIPLSLPILIIAFGYHNMIPTIIRYLDGDLKKVKKSLILGSLLAFLIYLVWNAVVLGIVPAQGENSLAASGGKPSTDLISSFTGISWVGSWAEILGFFALISSALIQTLGLSHFLADGFKVVGTKKEKWMPLLALAPPLILSILYPDLFLKALQFAGGFCTVILFGLFPVLMVWKGRYYENLKGSYRLWGGKGILSLLVLFVFFALLIGV